MLSALLLLIREMSLPYRLWLSVAAGGVKICVRMKKALAVHSSVAYRLRNQNCLCLSLAGKKTGVAVCLAKTNYENILKREIHCIIPFLETFGINDEERHLDKMTFEKYSKGNLNAAFLADIRS